MVIREMQRVPNAKLIASCLFLVVALLGAFISPRARAGSSAGIAAVAAGGIHTCVLTTAGGVKCWGNNRFGQLGGGTSTGPEQCGPQACSTMPIDVSGLTSGVAAISAGGGHTCILTTAGGVKCWGSNFFGQLGDGTTTDRATPVEVSGLGSGVAAVAAGLAHTCALTTAGGLKCWGWNAYGQLGDGTTTDRATPVDVSGLTTGAAAVSGGVYHTCALTTAGAVKCWGDNEAGQLGDGTTTSSDSPVDVSGLTSAVASVSRGGGHTCALTTAGGLKCWGYDALGQLGDGTNGDPSCQCRLTPVDVSGLQTGIAVVSGGAVHTCALTTGSGLKCWGENSSGQLGDGTTDPRTTPVDVSGLGSGVGAVSAGGYHTCALTMAGNLKCWGQNSFGQLGIGTADFDPHPVPIEVSRVEMAPGDANCDGSVDSIDATLVLQYSAGLLSSLPCADAADFNRDGSADAVDAALILQHSAGLLPDL